MGEGTRRGGASDLYRDDVRDISLCTQLHARRLCDLPDNDGVPDSDFRSQISDRLDRGYRGCSYGVSHRLHREIYGAMTLQWYCVKTKPFKNEIARRNLLRQSFSVCCPYFFWLDSKGTNRKSLLFPDFLFVGFDVERDQWRRIHHTRGVETLMYVGDWPVPLQRDFATTLLTFDELHDLPKMMDHLFEVGQRVQVTSGIWQGCEGIIDWSDQDRVSLLMTMFGAVQRASVKPSMIDLVA